MERHLLESQENNFKKCFAVGIVFLYIDRSRKKEVNMDELQEKYEGALAAIAYLHNELLAVKHCQCDDDSTDSEEDSGA